MLDGQLLDLMRLALTLALGGIELRSGAFELLRACAQLRRECSYLRPGLHCQLLIVATELLDLGLRLELYLVELVSCTASVLLHLPQPQRRCVELLCSLLELGGSCLYVLLHLIDLHSRLLLHLEELLVHLLELVLQLHQLLLSLAIMHEQLLMLLSQDL